MASARKRERVVVVNQALLDMAQNRRQIQLWRYRAMLIGEIRYGPREPFIPLSLANTLAPETHWLLPESRFWLSAVASLTGPEPSKNCAPRVLSLAATEPGWSRFPTPVALGQVASSDLPHAVAPCFLPAGAAQ